MLLIPEITLLDTLKNILQFLKDDFNEHTNEEDTFLHNMLFGNKLGEFDYYEQGKDLFLRESDHERVIDIKLFFDRERANIPTLHLNLPQDNGGPVDGIGIDEGHPDSIINETTGTITPVYQRSFDAVYNIIITSDNTFEVLLMYHVIRASLVSIFDSLDFAGLRNPKITGNELQLNPDIVPTNVFVRALMLGCFYEQDIPRFFGEKLIKSVNFNGKADNPIAKEQVIV